MSYDIKRTNGESVFPSGLPEKETASLVYSDDVTNAIGMIMIGKLVPEYGTDQSNNFVHLIENFANTIYPDKPLVGMLFYNRETGSLYLCTNEETKTWQKLAVVNFDNESRKPGDLWFDDSTHRFYVCDSDEKYVLIGPANYYHKYEGLIDTPDSLVTSSDSPSISGTINGESFEDNTSNLVTLKIVAKEVFSDSYITAHPDVRPESASWIYRALVQNYIVNDTVNVEIVGEPNYELIARTSNYAKDWKVDISINTEKQLVVSFEGFGDTSIDARDNVVKWTCDVEIVKV